MSLDLILQMDLEQGCYKNLLGEEYLVGPCRKNWVGKNDSKGSSLSLQALASTDRNLLVEQETGALQVLMVDIEGRVKGADKGGGVPGTWRKFREKIQSN